MAELTEKDFKLVDVYDEDYDESYDDEILEESEKEYEEEQEEEETEESEKSDNQMKKADELYLIVFRKYLEKECYRDEFFAKKYKPELLKDCYEYVKNEVRKKIKNNMVMLQSGTVFRMAIDYFNDDIYEKEQKAKAEKERIAKEKAEKEEQKRKEEQVKKEKENEWKELRKKFDESPSTMTDTEKEKFDQEKYKHLEQQNLFDF